MKSTMIIPVLLLLLTSCATSKVAVQEESFAANPVIAHRGAFKANNYPENSIASLTEAIRLQCAGSEFDVRMTVDDSLVISHDPQYHKMEIETTTFQELSKIPLSNGEALPTLRQYLRAGMVNNKNTRLVVEIKPSGVSKERGKQIAERVIKLVEELNAAPFVVYISFDYDILKRIVELRPMVHTQYLNGDVTPEQLKADKISGADYHLSVFQKHSDWIESAHKNNIVLNAWTVNSRDEMQWLLTNKFQYITTNEPEMLLVLWKSKASAKTHN